MEGNTDRTIVKKAPESQFSEPLPDLQIAGLLSGEQLGLALAVSLSMLPPGPFHPVPGNCSFTEAELTLRLQESRAGAGHRAASGPTVRTEFDGPDPRSVSGTGRAGSQGRQS